MSDTPLLVIAAVAVGAAVPLQSAINARMASLQGHPLYGAIANTIVATLCLLTLIVALRIPPPRVPPIEQVPPYLWIGGVIGACFVFGALYIAPRIGGALFAAAAILGTAVGSMAIDHFGLFGFPVRPMTLYRFAGASLLLGGTVLINAGRA